MKKVALILSLLACGTLAVPQAQAHDRGWSTAGKILTGVVAAQAIAHAINPPPVYIQPPAVYYPPPAPVYATPAPVYLPPRVVYVPAPVYMHPAPVIVRPAPVVVAPPVFCPPRPSFSFHIGFGGHSPRHSHKHRHWH